MTITAGIDVGTGVVKTAIFEVGDGKAGLSITVETTISPSLGGVFGARRVHAGLQPPRPG